MSSTIPEGPFRGSSPTRPAPHARRLHTALAALAVAAALLVGWTQPVAAQPSSEPGDPTPAACLSLTKLTKLTTTGGPFDGGTKITWTVTKPTTSPCKALVVTMNGSPVALNGSMVVDPALTSQYALVAKMGTASKGLGATVAVGGDIVGYNVIRAGRGGSIVTSIMNPDTVAADEARVIAGEIIGALSNEGRLKLLGRTIEVHIIPAATALTALPPWKSLAGKMTCDEKLPDGKPNDACVAPRAWKDVRGAGGILILGTNHRIATAVGEEALINIPGRTTTTSLGHTLAHELGHTVLDFAAPNEKVNVGKVLEGNQNHDYMGDETYTSSTLHEYFAEGAAGMFGYELTLQLDDEYTQTWLRANEPKLYPILARVFPGAL